MSSDRRVDTRPRWQPARETTTAHACARCGAAVSPRYHEKNRDRDTGRLHGCPECYSLARLRNGAHQRGSDGNPRGRKTGGLGEVER